MFSIGIKMSEKYPIYNSNNGDIVAECLKEENARLVEKALNVYEKMKKIEKLNEDMKRLL